MSGLVDLFTDIIRTVLEFVVAIITNIFPSLINETFMNNSFNIYLFSDTGWFTEPIMLIDIFGFIVMLLTFIFLIRIIWKGTKKFINMIFGVFRV